MKQCLYILIALIFYGNTKITASNVVTILNKGCNYSVEIPEGWDTIPKTALKEKIKQYNVDLGIYPISQKDYFNGKYAFFVFAPTIRSLNLLTFDQIALGIKNQIKQKEIDNDTLHVHFVKMDMKKENNTYSIYNYYRIWEKQDSLENCQTLQLTKFGYIMVLVYKKDIDESLPIEKVSDLLSKSISVKPDYIYAEPQKKGLSLKHIIISLAIGVFVYLLITGFSKFKKKK